MKIYNSLTRTKEEFAPLKPGVVGMYVCGPTVYDEPHIGHSRSAYIFDVIRRYLTYRGYRVTFVRNVTDIDDKIIEKAKKADSGKRIADSVDARVREISERYLAAYHEAMDALGIGRPDREPKATEYIEKMQRFIAGLIGRGIAYQSGADVYFDIRSAKGYGKLSNQSLEKMEVGARVSPGERKKDPLDFALWKTAKEGEPSWESPWGRGRPGWHIECSVMSSDILGDEFDIHAGGIDLIFPHHENEIAQSEGAGKKFARCWIHNGLLTIDSEKMAKSLGNFITIKGFLATYADPDYLKLFFLAAHYRSPIDFTKERIEEAIKEKERFARLFERTERIVIGMKERPAPNEISDFRRRFEEAMDDDFNMPLALAVLFDLVTYTNQLLDTWDTVTYDRQEVIFGVRKMLSDLSTVLGLSLHQEVRYQIRIDGNALKSFIEERDNARNRKDFKTADDIRRRLADLGVIIEDTKDGPVWRRKI